MELRRALLLFAIVLGLAAIVTSFSRPAERQEKEASGPSAPRDGTPTAGPRRTAAGPTLVSFFTKAKPQTKQLAAGRHGTVTVEVDRPGQVELAGLGQGAAAEPLTPARFDVLENRPGRHEVRFTPAAGGESRLVGTLQIVRRATGS